MSAATKELDKENISSQRNGSRGNKRRRNLQQRKASIAAASTESNTDTVPNKRLTPEVEKNRGENSKNANSVQKAIVVKSKSVLAQRDVAKSTLEDKVTTKELVISHAKPANDALKPENAIEGTDSKEAGDATCHAALNTKDETLEDDSYSHEATHALEESANKPILTSQWSSDSSSSPAAASKEEDSITDILEQCLKATGDMIEENNDVSCWVSEGEEDGGVGDGGDSVGLCMEISRGLEEALETSDDGQMEKLAEEVIN